MEHYENFKKNGYWQKLCLNCKNHEIIVNNGYRVDLFFRCSYLNGNVMSVNLSSKRKASKCVGWAWIEKKSCALNHPQAASCALATRVLNCNRRFFHKPYKWKRQE